MLGSYQSTNAQCNKSCFLSSFYNNLRVNTPFLKFNCIPMLHSLHNTNFRIVNGNINKNRRLNILHINKGSSLFENCLHSIEIPHRDLWVAFKSNISLGPLLNHPVSDKSGPSHLVHSWIACTSVLFRRFLQWMKL